MNSARFASLGVLVAACIGCSIFAGAEESPATAAYWLKDMQRLFVVGSGKNTVFAQTADRFVSERSLPSPKDSNAVYCERNECWVAGGVGGLGFIETTGIGLTSDTQRRVEYPRQGAVYAIVGARDHRRLYLAHATGELGVGDRSDLNAVSTIRVSSSELYALERDDATGYLLAGDERGELFVIADDGTPILMRTIAGTGAIFVLRAIGDGRVVVGRSRA